MKDKRERTAGILAGIHKDAVFQARGYQTRHAEEPGAASGTGILECPYIFMKHRPFLPTRRF